MNTTAKAALILLASVLLLSYVARNDYLDEVYFQLSYCANVKDKVWPDYEGSYRTECTADKLKEYEEILR